MTVLILKDHWSAYVEYDEETDVMFATAPDSERAQEWDPVSREPDLDVGVVLREEDVCIDRYCDEWEKQIVRWQVALRLRNAKSHGNFGTDKTLELTLGGGISIGLLNVLRHGQLAMIGQHWWKVRVKETPGMFDIEAVRAHVRETGHTVTYTFVGNGNGAFICSGAKRFEGGHTIQLGAPDCKLSWPTSYAELAGIKDDALMDQPGALERLANYINAAKNPTVWDRLGDPPV